MNIIYSPIDVSTMVEVSSPVLRKRTNDDIHNSSSSSKHRKSTSLVALRLGALLSLCLVLVAIPFAILCIIVGQVQYKHAYREVFAPAPSGYGYVDPKVVNIAMKTKCKVITPTISESPDLIRAQVEYRVGSESFLQTTYTTFDQHDKYAKYTSQKSVTCFYDRRQPDKVSYFKHTNRHLTDGRGYLVFGISGLSLSCLYIITLVTMATITKCFGLTTDLKIACDEQERVAAEKELQISAEMIIPSTNTVEQTV